MRKILETAVAIYVLVAVFIGACVRHSGDDPAAAGAWYSEYRQLLNGFLWPYSLYQRLSGEKEGRQSLDLGRPMRGKGMDEVLTDCDRHEGDVFLHEACLVARMHEIPLGVVATAAILHSVKKTAENAALRSRHATPRTWSASRRTMRSIH